MQPRVDLDEERAAVGHHWELARKMLVVGVGVAEQVDGDRLFARGQIERFVDVVAFVQECAQQFVLRRQWEVADKF